MASGGLQINVSYDSSVSGAPAGFVTAVQAAVQYFTTNFSAINTQINIAIGWGEVAGHSMSANALGQSSTNYFGVTYARLRSALAAADSGYSQAATAIANLPTVSPAGSDQFAMAQAEAKALGLYTNATAIDGYVGLSSTASFTFDPNNRAVSGKYDAIGTLEHEISEVLGRVAFAGFSSGGIIYDTPLDLFRYSSTGVHTYRPGSSFFSFDGVTSVKAFNNGNNGGDDGDWASSSQADAYDAFATRGVQASTSAADLSVMQLLGYRLSGQSPGPSVGPGIGGTAQAGPAAGGATINGGAGDDWLLGQGGKNILHGGGGSDYLDGGPGVNTAAYDGVLRQYTVGGTAAGVMTVSGGLEGGTDDLVNIQRIQFVDGYLATGLTDTAGQVYRIYEATLNRAPDSAGLADWVHQLNAGTSLQTVINGFVNSAEFQQRYGALDNTSFVTLLYQNVLHRAPDAAGLSNWVGILNGGTQTRAEVVTGFSQSQEDITALAAPVQKGLWIEDGIAPEVARLYDTTLGRLPDVSGLSSWTHQLDSGAYTLLQITQGFVGSPEFQAAYGNLNDSQFVQRLYQNALHRTADVEGLNSWTGYLAAGHSRAEVVMAFSESPEHMANTSAHIDGGIWVLG